MNYDKLTEVEYEGIIVNPMMFTSKYFPYMASPNFGHKISTITAETDGTLIVFEHSKESMRQFLNECVQAETVIITGHNELSSKVVAVKRHHQWIYHYGSRDWWFTRPVEEDALKMVTEYNAMKALGCPQDALDIYYTAVSHCVEDNHFLLTSYGFLSEQISLMDQ